MAFGNIYGNANGCKENIGFSGNAWQRYHAI